MKTYFIGLGGCGLQTVAELSKRLSKEKDYEKDYAFTYVDTDGYTKDDINKSGIVIQSSDFVDLGSTIPMAIYKEAEKTVGVNVNSKRFMEWVITQEPGHMVLPNYPLTDGATAQRMVGRTGLYNFYDAIYSELCSKINRFSEIEVDGNGRKDVDIWVITSSCGGTGSSMVLDILYMINRIGNSIVKGEPNVKLVLYMPQAFVESNVTNDNHKLNAYGCFSEINFFRSNFENGNRQTFEPFAARPLPTGVNPIDFPLYHFLIPVCVENNFGSKMEIRQFYPTIAEMIYYLNMGGAREKVKGLLSNILEEVRQNRLPGVTNQMIGYGFRAIKKANKELKEYLTRRALYEVIQYGLLDKTEPTNFEQLKKEFAQNAILKNLFTIVETIQESDREYKYDNSVCSQSIEGLVKIQLDGSIKYDATKVSADVVRAMSKRLNDALNGDSFNQIKKDIYALITNQIDVAVNTFIHYYGLNHAFNLLNYVDDFYLEPLYNYISTTLLPTALKSVAVAKATCDNFIGSSWMSKKITKSAEIHQYIQKYKDAVARAIYLRLSMEIIKELTERSTGYLEKLRKGDNMNFAGIRNLQKLLDGNSVDFADAYAKLAKEFRATAADIMTVYIPSLAEIATGEGNCDWAPNNIFDQLYQQSIIEQEQIEIGLEKKWVPVRKSESGRGLTDILERLDPNNNLFIRIIKDKQINVETNSANRIIAGVEHAVASLVNADNTSASDWINMRLSDAINHHDWIPKSFDRNPEKLFDSFKDAKRVPVFFPLKGGIEMPANMRLLFVGENKELATKLGYDVTNKSEQSFVEDPRMEDRFLVLRMPAGFSFDMYKYYPVYESFYNAPDHLYDIHHQVYGCHIHRAFNEYGFAISQNTNVSGSKPEISQPAKEHIDSLVRCLYYQHVVNLLWENDRNAYCNIFGYSTNDTRVNDAGLSPELLALLNTTSNQSAGVALPNQFISLSFDPAKFSIHLQMREVHFNPTSNNLEINSGDVHNVDFDRDHMQQCKAFVECLEGVPVSLFNVADYLAQRFDVHTNEKLNAALKNVQEEARKRLLNAVDLNNKPTFAFCFLFWKSNHSNDDKQYIEAIEDAISSL